MVILQTPEGFQVTLDCPTELQSQIRDPTPLIQTILPDSPLVQEPFLLGYVNEEENGDPINSLEWPGSSDYHVQDEPRDILSEALRISLSLPTTGGDPIFHDDPVSNYKTPNGDEQPPFEVLREDACIPVQEDLILSADGWSQGSDETNQIPNPNLSSFLHRESEIEVLKNWNKKRT